MVPRGVNRIGMILTMIELNIRGYDTSDACAECPCSRGGQPVKPVRAFGGSGGLCIVGEAPGQEETSQGFPFIGPSGRIINKALNRVGADRAYVWIANSLLCRRPSSDEDLDKAVACCRARLQADLELARPTAVCALGGTAMRALQLPVTFVSQARGTVQETPLLPGVPVIGALHPAALLHGGAGEMKGGKQKMNVDAQAMFLFADIAKAFKVSRGEVDPQWSDDIEVVHEASAVPAAIEALFADVYADGLLGIDLEWYCEGRKNALDALGANAHMAQITWVGLGCARRAVSFKWDALFEADIFPRLQQFMEDADLPKLAHNKQADIAIWEAQVGPICGKRLDSMLMHHVAFPGIDHDLQQVTSQFLCVPPWKVDHARKVAAHEARLKEEAKVVKAAEKEQRKADRVSAHEAANAKKKADAADCKAKRVAEHEARNAALAAGGKRARKKKEKSVEAQTSFQCANMLDRLPTPDEDLVF